MILWLLNNYVLLTVQYIPVCLFRSCAELHSCWYYYWFTASIVMDKNKLLLYLYGEQQCSDRHPLLLLYHVLINW